MKSLIKKIGIIFTVFMMMIIAGCAGATSATMGVGIPGPYPGSPGATIWIGRPLPPTHYDQVPAEQENHYGKYDATHNTAINHWPE